MANPWPEAQSRAQFNYDAKVTLADHSVRSQRLGSLVKRTTLGLHPIHRGISLEF